MGCTAQCAPPLVPHPKLMEEAAAMVLYVATRCHVR